MDLQPWLTHFAAPDHKFPWSDQVLLHVQNRRAQSSDVLIYDILLTSGGIQNSDSLYPPSTTQALLALLSAIAASRYDPLKKDCLVYFLLKWYQDDRETIFADAKSIPPQFTKLSDAYWGLDTGIAVAQAVSILADARLNRDYASKIIQAIALGAGTTREVHRLVLKYVRTAKPLLTEPDDLDAYAVALADAGSLYEAWQFQRTFDNSSDHSTSGDTQERLIHRILEWALYPNPKPAPLKSLVLLPLTPRESTILRRYATDPPPVTPVHISHIDTGNVRVLSDAAVGILRDLVCLREIQMGRWAEGIRAQREFASVPSPGGKDASGHAARAKMITEIMSALPAVERGLLEQEFSSGPLPRLLTSSSGGPTTTKSVQSLRETGGEDLEMSWDSIRPPASKSTLNGFNLDSSKSIQHVPTPPLAPWAPLTNTQNANGFVASALAPPRATNANTSNSSTAALGLVLTSASKSRNAFYDPLATSAFSNSGKRRFEEQLPIPSGSATAEIEMSAVDEDVSNNSPEMHPQGVDEDTNMDAEDDVVFATRAPRRQARESNGAEGLTYSVFSGHRPSNTDASQTRKSSKSGARPSGSGSSTNGLRRSETEVKLPPGAFLDDNDEEAQPQKQSKPRASRRRSPSPSPSRSPSPPRRSSTKAKVTRHTKSQKDKARQQELDSGLGRSLPGSLMDDHDEHYTADVDQEPNSEEEDHLAPLPPPTRSSKTVAAKAKAKSAPRKRRVSANNGSEQDSEPETQSAAAAAAAAAATPRRRSSRLSVASSQGDDEPVSVRKSTRASTGGRKSKR